MPVEMNRVAPCEITLHFRVECENLSNATAGRLVAVTVIPFSLNEYIAIAAGTLLEPSDEVMLSIPLWFAGHPKSEVFVQHGVQGNTRSPNPFGR
jgi:hypothetical protein